MLSSALVVLHVLDCRQCSSAGSLGRRSSLAVIAQQRRFGASHRMRAQNKPRAQTMAKHLLRPIYMNIIYVSLIPIKRAIRAIMRAPGPSHMNGTLITKGKHWL